MQYKASADTIKIIYAIPENELEIKYSLQSFVKLPMLDGRVPSRDVWNISRFCRLPNCPMDEGRVPLSRRVCNVRYDKLDIDQMDSGITPGVMYTYINNTSTFVIMNIYMHLHTNVMRTFNNMSHTRK
jgi:hypothetical protein